MTDTNDKSWQNNIVKKEYIKTVQDNQQSKGPFDGLAKFFGGK